MKKFLSILSVILFFGNYLKAQDSAYVINGNLEKIKSGTIYLNIYEEGKTFNDSSVITNGQFKFTGFVSTPFFASLTLPQRHSDYFTFYVEPGTMEISGRGDSLKLLDVKGSAVNADNKLLKERMKTITQWEDNDNKLYEQAYKDKNTHVLDSLDQVDNDILAAKRKVVAGFVKDYPKSVRGAMAIIENYGYYAEASDVEPLYDELDPAIQNSPKGKEIKKMIETYAKVAIGKPAPDITQFTPIVPRLACLL